MTPEEIDAKFAALTRFKVVSSEIWDKSFNVVDTQRNNRFGDPWVELCAVTLEEAVTRATEWNEAL